MPDTSAVKSSAVRRLDLSDCGNQIDNAAYHIVRYKWAMRLLRPTDVVLDVGCGTGYGARLLADRCARVVGYEPEAPIARANVAEYPHPRLEFTSDWPSLSTFDAITCFDVIEHVQTDEEFLAAMASRLQDGGVVFLSTPRKTGERLKNEHCREYDEMALRQLLGTRFSRMLLLGQIDEVIGSISLSHCWTFYAICFGRRM